MTRAQLQDIWDCQMAKCRHYRWCKVHWGRRCSHMGGRKIPRMRSMHNLKTVGEGV